MSSEPFGLVNCLRFAFVPRENADCDRRGSSRKIGGQTTAMERRTLLYEPRARATLRHSSALEHCPGLRPRVGRYLFSRAAIMSTGHLSFWGPHLQRFSGFPLPQPRALGRFPPKIPAPRCNEVFGPVYSGANST